MNHEAMQKVLAEVAAERARQDAKWGRQDHPWHVPGLSPLGARVELGVPTGTEARDYVEVLAQLKQLSYAAILIEEVCEAVDESDEQTVRRELVQIAAVAVAAIEAIDRRTSTEAPVVPASGASSTEGSIPSPSCPSCGRDLEKISYRGGTLNEEQWRAIRAGDWWCETCPDNGRGNSGAYYWDRELGVTP